MAQALEGADRAAPLCTLTPSLALYAFPQQHIPDCDQAMERVLRTFATNMDPEAQPVPPPTTTPRRPQRPAPACDRRTHLYRITGVELPQVPG